jgi:hypothetical protein
MEEEGKEVNQQNNNTNKKNQKNTRRSSRSRKLTIVFFNNVNMQISLLVYPPLIDWLIHICIYES